jgi:hypothetical protein
MFSAFGDGCSDIGFCMIRGDQLFISASFCSSMVAAGVVARKFRSVDRGEIVLGSMWTDLSLALRFGFRRGFSFR